MESRLLTIDFAALMSTNFSEYFIVIFRRNCYAKIRKHLRLLFIAKHLRGNCFSDILNEHMLTSW